MQQFNMLQAIYMSFYSKRLYRDIAQNWGGKVFLYLLLLVCVVSIYFTIALQGVTNVAYKEVAKNIFPQIPEITVQDGKISTPENRPYIITLDNKPFVIIDTSGQYKTLEEAKTRILITDKQIITENKPNETRIYTVPADMKTKIVPQAVDEFLQKTIGYLWIIYFILIVIAMYFYRLIQAFLYAILGKIFSLMFGVPLNYGQILQIAMVALTPAIILCTLQYAFNIHIPHQLLLYFILELIYLFYGILANKN